MAVVYLLIKEEVYFEEDGNYYTGWHLESTLNKGDKIGANM
jgi:hypothetical protein